MKVKKSTKEKIEFNLIAPVSCVPVEIKKPKKRRKLKKSTS